MPSAPLFSPTPDKRPIEETWVRYQTHPTEDLRNALKEHYLWLVAYTAGRLKRIFPGVALEDLMRVGIFGLLDAIDDFDTGRGMNFETYGAPRIRGAILNELRSRDADGTGR